MIRQRKLILQSAGARHITQEQMDALIESGAINQGPASTIEFCFIQGKGTFYRVWAII
jgi:hypothetical protein